MDVTRWVLQKLDIRRTDWSNHKRAGLWEEYRYDALGRRVLVRTRTDGGLCDTDAWTRTPSTTTFVWAGDQLLWELKEAGGTYAAAAGGNVGYFHAGGIDRPLVITKNGESIVPHQNWRGQFARGTYADGAKVGQRSDCTTYPASGCTPIQWPGERTTARHELEPDNNIQNWFGSLVDNMRDASGQMYRRNRYYDPQTGQFTQPDPIGLAGGLNAYGFAEGDPVSYGDPYGLCAYLRGIAAPCELILVIFGEASNESFWGMYAVGNVVRNRIRGPGEFRNIRSYEQAIVRSQFNAVRERQWNRGLEFMRTRSGLGGDEQAFWMAVAAAEAIFHGGPDNTGGATWFATPGHHGPQVRACVDRGECEYVPVAGDRDRHTFVRYRNNAPRETGDPATREHRPANP